MTTRPPEDLWIFGYSSLLWKHSDVIHTRSVFGYIDGYVRRFWQGSTDHRGTPERPGLVASIYSPRDLKQLDLPIPAEEDLRVYGRAFLVSGVSREKVISTLDGREVDGYVQRWVCVHSAATGDVLVKNALVYMAPISNTQFAGVLSEHDIIERIVRCRGDSGFNREYLTNLVVALREEGVSDPHLDALVKLLPPVPEKNVSPSPSLLVSVSSSTNIQK